MQIISKMALISINETLIVQVVSFLIFLFIINRLMFRPLREVMSERDSHMEDVKKDIRSAREKIEAINGQIRRQEAEVKNEAFKLKENLENKGQQQAQTIFETARSEMAAAKARVKADIEKQMTEAKSAVQRESELLAVTMIEKILDRRLSQ